jgi:hypothetical protein
LWEGDTPEAAFMKRLLRSRVKCLLNNREWLKCLRYRHKEVKWWQKRAGHLFEEFDVNLYEEIARAHGECWELPLTEEKNDPMVVNEKKTPTCPPPGSPTSKPSTPRGRRTTLATPTAKQ